MPKRTPRRFCCPNRGISERRSFDYARRRQGSLPTDVDLFRAVSLGLVGTPMPPWKHMLKDDERWAVVEYIKTFSPRFADTNEDRKAPVDLGHSTAAQRQRPSPRARPSLHKLNCFTCHGETGRGDGLSAATLVDDSGSKIKPRDFSKPGAFKAGYATKEIVRTVLTGLDGTPMVGFNGLISNRGCLEDGLLRGNVRQAASARRLCQGLAEVSRSARNWANRTCGSS